MNEVITDKDKEYEAMEQSSAPGPDQAMSDRVNNRSLRPRSEAFKEFMTTGWDDNEPAIEQDACAGIVCGSACEPLHAGLFHECPLWRILGWTSCRLAGDDCNDRY